MKLSTVWKWWDYRKAGLCKELASKGLEVRPLSYDDLSEKEQEIVYDYWLTCQLGRQALIKESER